MNVVQSLSVGIAKIAVTGCGPSVFENAESVQHVLVTMNGQPALTCSEIDDMRSNWVDLRKRLLPNDNTDDNTAASAEKFESKSDGKGKEQKGSSSKIKRSSRVRPVSTGTAGTNTLSKNISKVVLGAVLQGLLTASAFSASSHVLETVTHALTGAGLAAGESLPSMISALAFGLWGGRDGASATRGSLLPPTVSAAVGMQIVKGLLRMGLSLYGVVYVDTQLVNAAQKEIERDLRRRLMNKHFKELYFSRSAMIQTIGFSKIDLYESMQKNVVAWAADTTAAASLLTKLSAQLIVSLVGSFRSSGVVPTLQFLAFFTGSAAVPLLISQVAKLDENSSCASSRTARTSSRAASKNSTSSSAADKAITKRTATVSTTIPSPTTKRLSRQRLLAGLSKVLAFLCSANGVAIALSGAVMMGSSAAISADTREREQLKVISAGNKSYVASWACMIGGLLRLLFIGGRSASFGCNPPTSTDSVAVAAGGASITYSLLKRRAPPTISRAVGHWALTSLFLANACMAIASLVRTVYGPARLASRHASELLKKVEALEELRERLVNITGQGQGSGSASASTNSTTTSKALYYSREGDSIVVSALLIDAIDSPTLKNTFNSRGQGQKQKGNPALPLSIAYRHPISFSVAPGQDLLICVADRSVGSAIVELIGGLAVLRAPSAGRKGLVSSPVTPSSSSSASPAFAYSSSSSSSPLSSPSALRYPNNPPVAIRVPSSPDAMLFLGKDSFMPRLTLKQQILFPKLSSSHACVIGENGLLDLLSRVGMGNIFDQFEDALGAKGWDTPCEALISSRGGGSLSHSDRHRICLARALYHRPRFLFLDEATTLLSWAEEKAFYKLCREQSTTVITITDLGDGGSDAAQQQQQPSSSSSSSAVCILTRYAPLHKCLLQIDRIGSYEFGSFVSNPAVVGHVISSQEGDKITRVPSLCSGGVGAHVEGNNAASIAEGASPEPTGRRAFFGSASPHRLRRTSSGTPQPSLLLAEAERERALAQSLPALRVVSSSKPSNVGMIISFDAGRKAYSD